jgi:uncharacterized protein (DUF302 family)
MSCEICGRSSCCKSFHSIEAQIDYDEVADRVEERIKAKVLNILYQADGYHNAEDTYVVLYDKLVKDIEDM